MSNISGGSRVLSVAKSPVPYILLGGVGVMLVLIAFALIILACFYFKERTTGNAEDGEGGKNEKGEDTAQISDKKEGMRTIVIMAGQETPTVFAKPTSVAVEV